MIPQEQVVAARQANIINYVQAKGFKVKKEGSRYRVLEHDSLILTPPNKFFWNSRGKGGSTLDLAIHFFGLSFPQAVSDISGEVTITPTAEDNDSNFSIPAPQTRKQQSEKKVLKVEDLEYASDLKRTVAYLTKARLIDYRVVKILIEQNLLLQEKQNNNAVFPFFNQQGDLLGAELHGTLSDKRFKQVLSSRKFPEAVGRFNLTIEANQQELFFYESAIDLLSFFNSIGRLGGVHVSMAGRDGNIVRHFYSTYNPRRIVFAGDNDQAGDNFWAEIKQVLSGENVSLERMSVPPHHGKDWNDYLKSIKFSPAAKESNAVNT